MNHPCSKLAWGIGFGLCLFGQAPGPPDSGVTISVTTQLVLVNVLVHDRHGSPIGDLTKADFELKDAGKPQKISVFSVDQLAAAPGAPSSAAQVLPRNIVSNRPVGQTGMPASVTVVLVDTYNTKVTDQAFAKTQLTKFLHTVRAEDRIAIYTLNSNGFGIVHDFTNNASELEAAFSKTRPALSHQLDGADPEPADTGDDDLDATINASNAMVSNFFTRNRVLNTCQSFKALAEHLSGIPGRKNLIWLTGSVPISIGFGDPEDVREAKQKAGGAAAEQEHFQQYIDEATQALNTANVAVYPVDARGLLMPAFTQANTRASFNPKNPAPSSLFAVDNRNAETMDSVAELTGGKAFHNTNDLAGAVRKAMDDSAVTYTLGYYVAGDDWDNKYHSIKVSVNRSGAKVRTKKGYFAQEKPTPTDPQLDTILRSAIWSPLDSTKLAVTTHIDPSQKQPGASRFTYLLDPQEIQFKLSDGKYSALLDVLFVQQKKLGGIVGDQKKTSRISLPAERFKELQAKGITLSDDISIKPETVAMRIIVMDRATGNAGSVTVPIGKQDKSSESVATGPAPR